MKNMTLACLYRKYTSLELAPELAYVVVHVYAKFLQKCMTHTYIYISLSTFESYELKTANVLTLSNTFRCKYVKFI